MFNGHLGDLIRTFILLIICYEFSFALNSASSTPLNASEEIKNIFSLVEDKKNSVQPDLKGPSKGGNFAEGGLINVDDLSSVHVSGNKPQQDFNSSAFNSHNVTLHSNSTTSRNHGVHKSNYKTLQDSDISEPASNLFLGVPEVFHINGTSSIKPRKGVDNEIKENGSPLSNYSCFWLNENDCYNIGETKDLKCNCCKEGNSLGEIFKQQATVSCSKCKSYPEDKQMCKNICCKSVYQDADSKPTTHEALTKVKNNSKLKPTITKVPYDVEVMTELISKAKQKMVVPVIACLLLVPFAGILIFFIWRRTKEYWDNRFYKRMDFLIDGMYND